MYRRCLAYRIIDTTHKPSYLCNPLAYHQLQLLHSRTLAHVQHAWVNCHSLSQISALSLTMFTIGRFVFRSMSSLLIKIKMNAKFYKFIPISKGYLIYYLYNVPYHSELINVNILNSDMVKYLSLDVITN